jgi:hypothetical protein
MPTPESQKLLDAFMGANSKDRATAATIKTVDKNSSPPVSVLFPLM